VAKIHGVEDKEVFSKGRQQKKVKARSLLCYWAVREAGISLRTLAKRLGLSAPGVGYAVERGEAIVQESHISFLWLLTTTTEGDVTGLTMAGGEAAFPCLGAARRLERNHTFGQPLPPKKSGSLTLYDGGPKSAQLIQTDR
jgi:hypothetical protein